LRTWRSSNTRLTRRSGRPWLTLRSGRARLASQPNRPRLTRRPHRTGIALRTHRPHRSGLWRRQPCHNQPRNCLCIGCRPIRPQQPTLSALALWPRKPLFAWRTNDALSRQTPLPSLATLALRPDLAPLTGRPDNACTRVAALALRATLAVSQSRKPRDDLKLKLGLERSQRFDFGTKIGEPCCQR
jgi:hypothetical protein